MERPRHRAIEFIVYTHLHHSKGIVFIMPMPMSRSRYQRSTACNDAPQTNDNEEKWGFTPQIVHLHVQICVAPTFPAHSVHRPALIERIGNCYRHPVTTTRMMLSSVCRRVLRSSASRGCSRREAMHGPLGAVARGRLRALRMLSTSSSENGAMIAVEPEHIRNIAIIAHVGE